MSHVVAEPVGRVDALLWSVTHALADVNPWLIVGAAAAAYATLFVVLQWAVMPLSPTWRAHKDVHRIEWIMRIVATINGSVCGLLGLYCALFFEPTSVLVQFRVAHYLCAGYFVYDTLGNVAYFRLLRKRYILFHHLFCFLVETLTVFNRLDYFASVAFFGLLPDPIDHITWFLKRVNRAAMLRRVIEKANTYFFIVNRLLISNYYLIRSWRFEPSSDLVLNFGPTLFTYFAFVVYFGMNIMVSSQRLKPKRHYAPRASDSPPEDVSRYPYNVPSSPAPSRSPQKFRKQH